LRRNNSAQTLLLREEKRGGGGFPPTPAGKKRGDAINLNFTEPPLEKKKSSIGGGKKGKVENADSHLTHGSLTEDPQFAMNFFAFQEKNGFYKGRGPDKSRKNLLPKESSEHENHLKNRSEKKKKRSNTAL